MLSFVRKNDGLRRVSLELFCVIALLTLPAYQVLLRRESDMPGAP